MDQSSGIMLLATAFTVLNVGSLVLRYLSPKEHSSSSSSRSSDSVIRGNEEHRKLETLIQEWKDKCEVLQSQLQSQQKAHEQEVQTQKETTRGDLVKKQEQLESLEKLLKDMRSEVAGLHKERAMQTERENVEKKEMFNTVQQLQEDKKELLESVELLQGKIKEMASSEHIKEANDDTNRIVQQLQENLRESGEEASRLRRELESAVKEAKLELQNAQEKQEKALSQQHEQLQRERDEACQQLTERHNEQQQILQEKITHLQREKEKEAEIEQDQVKSQEEHLKKNEEQLSELQAKLDSEIAECKAQRDAVEEWKSKSDETSRENADLRRELEEWKEKMRHEESQLSDLRTLEQSLGDRHAKELQALKDVHKEQLAELEQARVEDTEATRLENEEQAQQREKELKDRHQMELETLKKDTEAAHLKYDATIGHLQKEKEELEAQLRTSSESSNRELESLGEKLRKAERDQEELQSRLEDNEKLKLQLQNAVDRFREVSVRTAEGPGEPSKPKMKMLSLDVDSPQRHRSRSRSRSVTPQMVTEQKNSNDDDEAKTKMDAVKQKVEAMLEALVDQLEDNEIEDVNMREVMTKVQLKAASDNDLILLKDMEEDNILDFCEFCGGNETIKSINLSGAGVTPFICNELVRYMTEAKKSKIERLDLSNNALDDGVVDRLSALLTKSSTLKSLNLANTGVSADKLLDSLSKNMTITSFVADEKCTSSETMEEIARIMSRN